MFNVCFFGAPGSGKGTQAKLVSDYFCLKHLSTGDLFRKEVKKQSNVGKYVYSYIKNGELIPDATVLKEIYREALIHYKSKGFVFDGFPRTLNQAIIFDRLMDKKKLFLSKVIYIDVKVEELFKRLMIRARNSGRIDDNEETIHKRLLLYKETAKQVIDYYSRQEKIVTIDGNKTITLVKNDIIKAIDNKKQK